jgi:hypothetical protein
MVLLNGPIDGFSSIVVGSRKSPKTVDATHPDGFTADVEPVETANREER